MTFSEAQFEAVVQKLDTGMAELSGKIPQLLPAARAATDHLYVPDSVQDAIMWLAHKMVSLAQRIWDKITELMKGIAAPVLFFKDAFDWEDVKGLASGVAGELTPTALRAGRHWSGAAEEAYVAATAPQATAAARIATLADKVALSLGICAAAGLAFYVAIGVILVKFIAALVAAIAAFGSAVFSWAGAALVVEEAGVNTGLIIAAVTTLTALLGAQAQQLVALHGEAVDDSTFPGGHWPDPNTGGYAGGGWRYAG